MMRRWRIAGLLASVGLASCAAGPDFKVPSAPQAQTYGSAPLQGAISEGDRSQQLTVGADIPAQWWSLFQSPKLNHLIEQALQGNTDVGSAQAALRQAHELYKAQWGSEFPVAQGSFSATRSKNAVGTISNPTNLPQQNPYYNLFTAELTLSYYPDIFGGARRAREQSHAELNSARFQLEATYLTLTSNVVVTAIQEASLRGQISATRRLVALQQGMTERLRAQRKLGTVSDLDVLTQESLAAETLQTLLPLQKQLGQTRDALTALLGRLPSDEPPDSFEFSDLQLPLDLPVSVPSKLIEQRPDVRQAQENLHVASAAVGIAVANRLPQFAINADVGSDALSLRKLFTPYTGFWDLGTTLTQTLFDAGALRHKQRAAEAALDQASAQYRGAVILACENVADTLRALKSDADAVKASMDLASTAKRTFDLVQQQRALGTVSVVVVVNAEQNYRQAELGVVQAQANRYADTAGLFQALGGGWWNRTGEPRYGPFRADGEY